MIVFCLPGNTFSGRFLDCFANLLEYCHRRGIKYVISRKESPNIYYARNLCLGGNTRLGQAQKPFNGVLDYTHTFWIDSDILFEPRDFQRLLDADVDIISGIYKTADGVHYATVKKLDGKYYEQHGHFEFMTDPKLETIKVAYTGFGFTCVKRRVLEEMTYPWFRPAKFSLGPYHDFCTEDVSFCNEAQKLGFSILVDCSVRLMHEKMTPLF